MRRVLFLLGAGASADAGLPSYRGVNGLYGDTDESPEDVLTFDGLCHRNAEFWHLLRPLYQKIASLDRRGDGVPFYTELATFIRNHTASCVVATQNIDGLVGLLWTAPQATTKKILNVVELHGRADEFQCTRCFLRFTPSEPFTHESRIHCPNHCAKRPLSKRQRQHPTPSIRPSIILFGEPLRRTVIGSLYVSIKTLRPTDIVVVGTSLQFQYLLDMIRFARSQCDECRVHVINPDLIVAESIRPALGVDVLPFRATIGLRVLSERFSRDVTCRWFAWSMLMVVFVIAWMATTSGESLFLQSSNRNHEYTRWIPRLLN